jgi:hypothetical protein
MKLAAIYNVFDGEELLEGSIKSIHDFVDVVIIVFQTVSAYGESYFPEFSDFTLDDSKSVFVRIFPNDSPRDTEIKKRNIGLAYAKKHGCTHFLHMDCDEYYQDFGQAKEMYLNTGAAGSVCRLHTYFKKPTLRLDRPENYFVPFIHELKPHTKAGSLTYPFYVDPTRRINESDVIELPIFMHHYSWVRKDIGRKVRNSTARKNIEKKSYLDDYNKDLKDGDYLPCYERNLIEVPDYFNINAVL